MQQEVKRMRIIGLTLHIWLAFGVICAATQNASPSAPGGACIEFNRTVLNQVSTGRLADAEAVLSRALASSANGLEPLCTGFLLHNMAVIMSASGRPGEAESFAERSVKVLEQSYPPEDLALLRPLASLSSALLEQHKIGKARAVFQRMLSVRTERPDDRAVLHTTAAALLQAEARYKDAESEYFRALAAREEAGGGPTADIAQLLSMLANLYIVDKRFDEAGHILDRALVIFAVTGGGVLKDRATFLNSQAAVHIHRGEWRKAEEVLRSAITAADSEMRLDPVALETLLGNYAYVLRKNHRRREARAAEARAATLYSDRTTDSVVDASELLPKTKAAKK